MKRIFLALAACLTLTSVAMAQEPKPLPGKDEIILADAKAPVDDKLPNVLLIGDSISMGFTPTVVKELKGAANVYRLSGTVGATINGSLRLDSTNGVNKIDGWLAAKKWAVIHFNWGLHDIKMDKDGKHQVPQDEYEKNLKTLVEKMKAGGAKLIWASTTPVPEGKLGPARKKGDEELYNAAARKIMEENQIAIDDLYSFILPRAAEAQQPKNVHFTAEGYKLLGEEVAAKIRALL